MNREIKFRAWANPNEDWFKNEGPHMIGPETLKQMANHKTSAFPGEWTWQCLQFMQYTGLKDKYGKEIYEGDIVRYTSPAVENVTASQEWVEDVVFADGSFNVDGAPLYVAVEMECEIIGNIIEHAHLLKQ